MNICLQCALRTFVETNGGYVDGPKQLGVFQESPEEHMQRHHPNGFETAKERLELEEKAQAIIQRRAEVARNAHNN